MKSLKNSTPLHKAPEIFTPEIIIWLEGEGFKVAHNDSYCDKLSDDDYEGECYYKTSSEGSDFHIGVYIFSYGIGVDVDYDYGGNMNTSLWKFSDYSFEEAYDKMVDYVQEQKN